MIGDDVVWALDELRAQTESLMLSTGTVSRVVGMVDDGNGREVPQTQPVYTGKARLVRPAVSPQQITAGGATFTVQRPQLQFPVGSFQMRVGDVWTCTGNPLDPSLVGRRYRLTAEEPAGTIAVAYKVQVEEIV